ncbi:MAG: hypothetical protein NC218_02180 [Acetobacter sp.]|nr:hypothetical protein [Acetobacter sp.]
MLINPRDRKLVEDAQALAALDILQSIESLYAYEKMDPLLEKLLYEKADKFSTYAYKRPLILLPLHPEWVTLILQHKKTRELRLSIPPTAGPFTALMYEAKIDGGSGMVVGEFTVPTADQYAYIDLEEDLPFVTDSKPSYYICGEDLDKLCLTYEQVEKYGKGRPLYGWHIEGARCYNKPRPLSHYYRPQHPDEVIKKAPQMYMEVCEVGEEI